MTYINLTPHRVTLVLDGGERVVNIPPTGDIARIEFEPAGHAMLPGDVPVRRLAPGKVEGLPEPKEGTFYIVSLVVAQQAARADVLAPDTARAVRDEQGRVIGVPGFISFGKEAQ